MKAERTTKEEMDLSFELPETGSYAWQIDGAGIKKFADQGGDKEKDSIMIPMKPVVVIKGSQDSIGRGASLFVRYNKPFGEKMLNTLLTITGLIDEFIAKFGGEFDPGTDKFIGGLQVKLAGKVIGADHEVVKQKAGKNEGKDAVQFTKIYRYKPGGAATPAATEGATATEEAGW